MNRRDFVRTLVAPAFIWPLTRSGGQGQGQGTLFVISDHPERYVPHLIEELRRQGIAGRNKPSVRSAGIQEFQPPSFTATLNGRVIDLRRPGLASLWQDMQRENASRRLTVVEWGGPGRPDKQGAEAVVRIDGFIIDRLPLRSNIRRVYPVRGGCITVRTGQGAVRVEDSPCRQKICASSPPISAAGERIICAPARFIIEIPGRGAWDTTTG